MFVGAHTVIYSKDPDADRAFLRDVFDFPHVDAGGGWLIFGLPPGEVAVHPAEENELHELYLMCDDVDAFVAKMASRGVPCSPIESPGWGRLTRLTLPGGGRLGVYQPRHARPKAGGAKRAGRSVKKARRPRAASKPGAATRKRAARRGSPRPRGRSAARKR